MDLLMDQVMVRTKASPLFCYLPPDQLRCVKSVLRLLSPFRLAFPSHSPYHKVISISISISIHQDELRLFTVEYLEKLLVYHSSLMHTRPFQFQGASWFCLPYSLHLHQGQ